MGPAAAAAIEHDYELARGERAAVLAAISSVPDAPELTDQQLEQSALADAVLSVLATCRVCQAALGREV